MGESVDVTNIFIQELHSTDVLACIAKLSGEMHEVSKQD